MRIVGPERLDVARTTRDSEQHEHTSGICESSAATSGDFRVYAPLLCPSTLSGTA